MKHAAVILFALLVGCGGSQRQQAAEDAVMLAEARELVALTKAQVHVRKQIVDNAGSLPDPKQREFDRLELENAEAELARLTKWVGEFEAAQKEGDEATLEKLRRAFRPMVLRLRNG